MNVTHDKKSAFSPAENASQKEIVEIWLGKALF